MAAAGSSGRAPSSVFTVAPLTTPSSRLASPMKLASRGSAGWQYRSPGGAHWAILPSRRAATRSATESASSWSWVTSTAVVPARRKISWTSARTLARRCASSEANGSSSRTTAGSMASARASATRCCWPPES